MVEKRRHNPKQRNDINQAVPTAYHSVLKVLAAVRQGDDDAATALFARYVTRLTALARKKLSRRLAPRVDASDIVMSAYRSFFVGLRSNRIQIAAEAELWQLLVQITLRKLYRQAARHTAQKRDVRRELSVEATGAGNAIGRAPEPTPEQALMLVEELERFLGALPALGRRVAERRLQGSGISSIARSLDINERTVRRWLDRTTKLLAVPSTNGGKTPARLESQVSSRQRKRTKRSRAFSEQRARFPRILRRLDYRDYVLQKLIGAGASGKVYRAECRHDGRLYALKFLRKQFISNSTAVQRFLDECALVQELEHPHIMPILGVGTNRLGQQFCAMPLAAGDLDKLAHTRRSGRTALDAIRQAATGLNCVHVSGILHCDLKPTNLLVNESGAICVTDFGLALRRTDRTKSPFRGTPAFMAPEQVAPSFGSLSPATDVYGLGATLYWLLTGQLPFPGSDVERMLEQIASPDLPLPPRQLRRGITIPINDLCMRCLAKRTTDRFATMLELIQAIDAALGVGK